MQTIFLLSLRGKKQRFKTSRGTKNYCAKTILKNDDLVRIWNHRKIPVHMLPKFWGRPGPGAGGLCVWTGGQPCGSLYKWEPGRGIMALLCSTPILWQRLHCFKNHLESFVLKRERFKIWWKHDMGMCC